jgi:CHAT domain-containing protein/tetratricopeptide (TPR) repeat protein
LEESPNSSSSSSSNVHIGPAELARLLEQSRRRTETKQAVVDMHPHFAACSMCRDQFEELAALDRRLMSMRPVELAPRLGDCPEPGVWVEIAGGLTADDQTLASLEHASRCDHCGPLLRAAMSEFSELNEQLSAEDERQIAALTSASVPWQKGLAHQIAATSRGESASWWQKWVSFPRLALAGVVLLVLFEAWIGVRNFRDHGGDAHRNRPADAERLLARAYTQQRTLELRIPGAAYAPLRISRGAQASFASRPPALLQAEALIARQLPSSDSGWLQAEAQADILEGKYDAAVEALHRALELDPHSPGLLTDLATAHFQRDQLEDKKEDLGAAYEYLSQALKLRPDDPVALFNRALVAEHNFLYLEALDDWDRYLKVDPNSEWSVEAREAEARVRAKVKEHSAIPPLLSPAQIAAAADDPNLSANLRSTVDARVEEYLSGAIRSWLPQAYPEQGPADLAAQRALFFLADLTRRKHHDQWLSNLLRSSSGHDFSRAVAALAKATEANRTGEYSTADVKASEAERFFRTSIKQRDDQAGQLSAQFDLIFAAQMERHSDQCRHEAAVAAAESEKHAYAWLQIQSELEQGVCSGLMGDFGSNEKAVRRALSLAQADEYGALSLRAIGFLAGDQKETGNAPEGWKLVSTGLDRYWSGEFPVVRGFNLYTELASLADASVRPNLQMAAWREAIGLAGIEENVLFRAKAHRSMADAATAAHHPRIAQQQYAEAARLFTQVPQTEANIFDSLDNEIRTARLEASEGELDSGIARLTRIQDQLRPLSNNYLVQMFYSTLGGLQLKRHNGAEAEQSLRPALALAEQSLSSIHSEAERIRWSKGTSTLYLSLAQAELMQGHSQESFETYEWYMGASERVGPTLRSGHILKNPPMPIPTTDPTRLGPRVPATSQETVVAYAALPDGLAIWICNDSGVSARWIPQPTDELQELAERFRDLSADRASQLTALRRDASSLYTALISPIEPWLVPDRTLVIEADGWLSRVPFEALLDSNGRYLIERAPIVHSLGQDSDLQLRDDGPISADLHALAVGSARASQADGMIPLPDVSREADAVGGRFKSSQILKNGEATLAAVKNDLPGSDVFHFAGHSLASPDRDGLLLENGKSPADSVAVLDADALRHLNLRSLRLAVLSACGPEPRSGDSGGFNNIAETFLRARVPHVVASRWSVDSVAARGFVDDFYRNALSGQSVSESVRLTAQRMLADPRTSHPYYWSAFAAYGRP